MAEGADIVCDNLLSKEANKYLDFFNSQKILRRKMPDSYQNLFLSFENQQLNEC